MHIVSNSSCKRYVKVNLFYHCLNNCNIKKKHEKFVHKRVTLHYVYISALIYINKRIHGRYNVDIFLLFGQFLQIVSHNVSTLHFDEI